MMPNVKKPDADPFKGPGATSFPGASGRPAPLQPRSERSAPSVIAADLSISGNLVSKGEVQIEGEVQGDIRGTNVVVGERAHITGNVIAEEVVVRGNLMGSIRGRRVMLQSTCHVEGDVFHQTLAIEQGAFFEGKSRRTADPLAGEPVGSSGSAASGPTPFPAA